MTNNTTILDGGMGRELERIGAPFSQPLWSAQALMEAPERVVEAHCNFIDAGAQVITTNSYAVVPPHVGQDLFDTRGAALIALSGKLAREAADGARGAVQVAGCIPPVFGSYKPDLFDAALAPALLAPFFDQQAPYADLWLVETVGSMAELRAICALYHAHESALPLWVALTLTELNDTPEEPELRSGERLRDVLPEILGDIAPDALLFNCCAVEDILPAVRCVRDALTAESTMQIGAYANAFTNLPEPRLATITAQLRHDVTPEFYRQAAQEWQDAGASIIGGCCGIMPDHIKALATGL